MSDSDMNGLSLIAPSESNHGMRQIGAVAAARKQVSSAHDGLDVEARSQVNYTSKLKLKSGEDVKNPAKLSLIDTHAHIHDPEFKFSDPAKIIDDAAEADVSTILVVGTSVSDSFLAAEFALKYDRVFAIVGSHPHTAKKDLPELHKLEELIRDPKLKQKIVGIGEIGLDFYYNNSPRGAQMRSLEYQLSLADKFNLPVSFHVREAFDDFWFIYDQFRPRGVLHSFTDSAHNMSLGLERGLYFGLNGISTFTKDEKQLKMFNSIPLERIVLETDAPFLTPKPHRGKINLPAYVKLVAEDIANKRGLSLAEVAETTTNNACFLFNLPSPT